MTHSFALPRKLMVLGVVLPLAAIVGYFLATPDQITSLGLVGMVLGVLALPLLLHYHYPMLLFSWNAALTVFLLPGQPGLWMLMTALSLGMTFFSYGINRQVGFLHVPSITWPLIFLALVLVVTAKLTGGIGMRSLGGGAFGGKKYITALGAILGYYAISCHRIPAGKANRYSAIYFLSGLTHAFTNLIYMSGPGLWWLFLVFTPDMVMSQAVEDFQMTGVDTKFSRLGGMATAAIPVFGYLLMRFGIRGIMDLRKPWRLPLVLAVVSFGTLGGFRSVLLIFGIMFAVQFVVEGLHRTWRLPVLVLVATMGFVLLVPFARHLPLSVQRALTILPVEVDAYARQNAQGSIDWRVEMWRVMYSQVPQYLWLGKGYSVNPADLYLTEMAVRQGLLKSNETALVAGDYHSGPLSVLIPLGIPGLLGFLWLLGAGLRLLYRNLRYGEERLKLINTFLLSYFLARSVFYFVGFGAFNIDLALFLGLLGLSVALNGGMRRAPTEEELHAAATAEPAQAQAGL